MANLFFVHTPLQLMIAQQIISQEKLKNNIMLYSYVFESKKLLDTYELMTISSLWAHKRFLKDLNNWAFISPRSLFSSTFSCYRKFKIIEELVKKNNVDSVYLSDINNRSYKLTALFYHKKGLKVSFFEDGSSHYMNLHSIYKGAKIIRFLIGSIWDYIFYLPLMRLQYGKFMFYMDYPNNMIPIDSRYSLIPYYKEQYDIHLQHNFLYSDSLKDYLNYTVGELSGKDNILFITSPIYEDHANDNSKIYLDTISEFIKKYNCHNVLFIKFHPRERENDKKEIINILNKNNIEYRVLSSEYSIPVEYYLNYIKFREIVCFYTTTALYNGYLFPRTKFTFLYKAYYNNCLSNNAPNVNTLKHCIDEFENVLSILKK